MALVSTTIGTAPTTKSFGFTGHAIRVRVKGAAKPGKAFAKLLRAFNNGTFGDTEPPWSDSPNGSSWTSGTVNLQAIDDQPTGQSATWSPGQAANAGQLFQAATPNSFHNGVNVLSTHTRAIMQPTGDGGATSPTEPGPPSRSPTTPAQWRRLVNQFNQSTLAHVWLTNIIPQGLEPEIADYANHFPYPNYKATPRTMTPFEFFMLQSRALNACAAAAPPPVNIWLPEIPEPPLQNYARINLLSIGFRPPMTITATVDLTLSIPGIRTATGYVALRPTARANNPPLISLGPTPSIEFSQQQGLWSFDFSTQLAAILPDLAHGKPHTIGLRVIGGTTVSSPPKTLPRFARTNPLTQQIEANLCSQLLTLIVTIP